MIGIDLARSVFQVCVVINCLVPITSCFFNITTKDRSMGLNNYLVYEIMVGIILIFIDDR